MHDNSEMGTGCIIMLSILSCMNVENVDIILLYESTRMRNTGESKNDICENHRTLCSFLVLEKRTRHGKLVNGSCTVHES